MEELNNNHEEEQERSHTLAKLAIAGLVGSLILVVSKAEASRDPQAIGPKEVVEAIVPSPQSPESAPEQPVEFTGSEKLKDFTEQYKSAGLRVQEEFGVPYQVTLAQAMLESGYGASELSVEANNMFGMKANEAWHGDTYEIITGEHTKNGPVKVMAVFKKFASVEEGFLEYGNYLKNRGFYDDAFENSGDPAKFLQCLVDEQGPRYATDPNYASKVLDIMNQIQSLEGSPNFTF